MCVCVVFLRREYKFAYARTGNVMLCKSGKKEGKKLSRKYRCVSHTVVLSVSDFASLECQRRACLHINTRAYKLRQKRWKKEGRLQQYFFRSLDLNMVYAVALGRGHSTVKQL